jgi:maltose O-acetyltransferase
MAWKMQPPMNAEKQKMLAGDPYDPGDPELSSERHRARTLCHALNALDPAEPTRQRTALLVSLFGYETDARISSPFFCDYGYNIKLGANAYFNFNCVVLDVVSVSIGNNALFGPGVHIYTACHSMSVGERRLGLEFGAPVAIGDDVWVGGSVVICPGVSIGSGSVIGAGSVVTRDIPDGVFAAGNPCRVIRKVKSNTS